MRRLNECADETREGGDDVVWSDTRSARRRLSAVAAIGTTCMLAPLLAAAPAGAANADIGYPEFTGSDAPIPATEAVYTPGNQLQAIYEADLAKGAGTSPDKDFWVDRMLARTGTAGSFGDENQWLFSRGRAAFMKVHDPAQLGFGGQLAYWESIDGRGGYTISATVAGEEIELSEDTSKRKQTPSYWRSVHANADTGVEIVQTKYVTDANVLVTELEVRATAGAVDVGLRAASPYAKVADGDELTGTIDALNDITIIHPRFSGDGFAPAGGGLETMLSVPAGGSAATKVQLGLVTDEIADSRREYDAVAASTPAEAYTEHVTAYNEWWAQNVPYLDTPEDNIDKTLFYRWWLLRFNFLDANAPGNAFQFPTAVEGALGYNNAIDLTVGMFVDDLKYFRNPIYSYGGWVSAGEVSKGGAFVDNPGDPANWNTSHTQYISESAWESYRVHGGPDGIVENLARYAEDDAKGQLEQFDKDDNGLLEISWNAWTGNDADAVSFDYYGRANERAESAYVYAGANSAAAAYRLLGDEDKADEMHGLADKVKRGVLDNLWDPEANLIKHRDVETGELIPWKEINNYYPYSVGLMPKPGDDDYDDDYVDALRLFADDAEYPIFPFTTANQADKAEAAEAGHPGTNNFSIINSTVTFRMLATALREYPTDAIDAEWYKKLLYWNAWAHYQNGGDNRLPDQNEFWADGSTDPQSIEYRSWIHHTILGTTNFTMIEDAMGLQPRTDAKIELYPIDIDWPHFTANNLTYHGSDLTITWDEPGDGERPYGAEVPEGYSVFLDGDLAFTVDSLAHLVYDPATGEVEFPDDAVNTDAAPKMTTAVAAELGGAQDVAFDDDSRVVDLFQKAGQDISSTGAENLAQGATATATFEAEGRPAAAAADGTTVNEPFWGTKGSENATDSLEVDLGEPQAVDTVRAYFYDTSSSTTAQGYAEPSRYSVEYHDGSDWKPVPKAAKSPAAPRANLNEVSFEEVTTDRIRLTVAHADGSRTGVKELQALHTGAPAEAAENAAPTVIAYTKAGALGGGSAELTGIVKDDGRAADELTTTWTVEEAPEGASTIFDDADRPNTTVRFTEAGTYRLRLTADDGELATSDDVVFTADEAGGGANVAPSATPSASYTAGWNQVGAVNDGSGVNSGGDQSGVWATWSGERPESQWLQYTWEDPVRVNGSDMMFWTDTAAGTGDGVAVPDAWRIEYLDADGEWADAANPSEYGTAREGTNATAFDPITTTALRAVFQASPNADGSSYSAVGVSEWQVFAEAPEHIDPLHVRTGVGKVPEMPSSIGVTYADGSRGTAPVAWEAISDAQVASENDFEVRGVVSGAPEAAAARIWVRAADAVTINLIDEVPVATAVGTAPSLPGTVVVLYNDGSRENLPVTWADIDPAEYAQAGEFEVGGTVQTEHPGETAAVARVAVGEGGSGGTDLIDVEAAHRCVAGTGAVTVRVTNIGEETATVKVATEYGEKTLEGIVAGSAESAVLRTRLAATPAGQVEATAASGDLADTVTEPFEAFTCE
ncbi:Ig-like domain-containing protein [Microbacterium halophytorum]|uniref:Ig-like domain-containing protein n=1 Tax=Microbacterium halophytorum TaxID=2067568 RepID=UPI001E62367B|nr:Ig-like domain-containing protein [Microbacterium halophytorum]